MKDRLKQIVNYRTGGKQKTFAELMEWSPAYLTKLLRGDNFGLQPILTLLEKLPEINARWFLFGEGHMLDTEHYTASIRDEAMRHVQEVLDLERFLPVMTAEELQRYEQIIHGASADFTAEDKARWLEQSYSRQQAIEERFKEATKQSDELCRQQTAKEL